MGNASAPCQPSAMRTAAVLGLFVVGCYSAHALPDAALPRDGGLDTPLLPDVPDASEPPDAPPAPPPDAPACVPDPAADLVALCTVSGGSDLPRSISASITAVWRTCACREPLCAIAADEGARTIDAQPSPCERDVCDECSGESSCPGTGSLPDGEYTLEAWGRDVYDVTLAPETDVRLPRCFAVPDPIDPALTCPPGSDDRVLPAEVCFPSLDDVGAMVAIDVTATCGSCFDASGGCEVIREGLTLVVRPRVRHCACPTCGDCAEVCTAVPIVCRSPALRDGRYRVVLDALGERRPVGELEIADVTSRGATTCVAVE